MLPQLHGKPSLEPKGPVKSPDETRGLAAQPRLRYQTESTEMNIGVSFCVLSLRHLFTMCPRASAAAAALMGVSFN